MEPSNGQIRVMNDNISMAHITVGFGNQNSHFQAFRIHLTHKNVLTCTMNVTGRRNDGTSFVKKLKFKTALQERGKEKKTEGGRNDVEKSRKAKGLRRCVQEAVSQPVSLE